MDNLLIETSATKTKSRAELSVELGISEGAIRNREKFLGIVWNAKDMSGKNNPMYGAKRPDFKKNHWTKTGYSQDGKNNPAWKGGSFVSRGYKFILKKEHPNSNVNGYIMEHRLVMSDYLGRELEDDEVIHHLNGNTLDNRLENLKLMSQSEHIKNHWENNDIR